MNEPPEDALQRLIRQRMLELGLSYGDVSRRSGLPRSTVHHLATHGRSGRPPSPATMERLATGLDVPLSAIRVAAAAAAGLALEDAPMGDPEVEVLVASLARLSPADRRHVAALVRSLLNGAGAVDGQAPVQAPGQEPGPGTAKKWPGPPSALVGTGEPWLGHCVVSPSARVVNHAILPLGRAARRHPDSDPERRACRDLDAGSPMSPASARRARAFRP
jgi:transcriptional regulator with XRE-family HTH domain